MIDSVHAEGVKLRILRLADTTVANTMELELNPVLNRTGDVWHIEVHNLKDLVSVAYVWLADGELGWRGATRFSPGAPLLDPYATVATRVQLPATELDGRTIVAGRVAEPMYEKVPERPRAIDALNPPVSEPPQMRPRVPLEDLALLELDPFTFATAGEVQPGREGKWLGVLDRLHIIAGTGASAVLLPSPMLRGPGLGVQV